MRLLSLAFAASAASLMMACNDPYMVPPWPRPKPVPLPEVSLATISPMKTAFLGKPLECRKTVQRDLSSDGGYNGPIDGRWSTGLGQAIIDFVLALGPVAHGWPTVPGSEGILWIITSGDASCSIRD